MAKDHDIVINAGSSIDPTLSEAIVSGQKRRLPGLKTTLVHVSGAGNFTDTTSSSGSTNPKAKVWNVSVRTLIAGNFPDVTRMPT